MNKNFKINFTTDMVKKIKEYIEENGYDDSNKNILIYSKAVANVMVRKGVLYNTSEYKMFSFDEIEIIEQILNAKKSTTKIYKTDNGNYSLEPIYNNGRYCDEELCDFAGMYAIPENIRIIISGGRMRFEDDIFFIDNKGEPALGIYKHEKGALKLKEIVVLEAAVTNKCNDRKTLIQVKNEIEKTKFNKKISNICSNELNNKEILL